MPCDRLVDTGPSEHGDRLLIEQSELKAEALPLGFGLGFGNRLAERLLLSVNRFEDGMESLHALSHASDFTLQANSFRRGRHAGNNGELEPLDEFIYVAGHSLKVCGLHEFIPLAQSSQYEKEKART
jgi:hypothetical protein